jgi:hypothetical protein
VIQTLAHTIVGEEDLRPRVEPRQRLMSPAVSNAFHQT